MLALAALFVREHFLKLLLIALGGYALAVLGAAWLPAEGELARSQLLLRVALSAIELMVLLPVVFTVAWDIPTDTTTGRIAPVLAAPLSRWRYIAGKALGAILLTALLAAFLHWGLLLQLSFAKSEISDALVPARRVLVKQSGEEVAFDDQGRPPNWETLQETGKTEIPDDATPEERIALQQKERKRQFEALAAREGRMDVEHGERMVWEFDIPRAGVLGKTVRLRLRPKNLLSMTFPAIEGVRAEVVWSQPGFPERRETVLIDYRHGVELALKGLSVAPGKARVWVTPKSPGDAITLVLSPDRTGREQRGLALLTRPTPAAFVSLQLMVLTVTRASILCLIALAGSTFLSGGVGVLLTLFVYIVSNLRSFLDEIAHGVYRASRDNTGAGFEPPGPVWQAIEWLIEKTAFGAARIVPDLQHLDGTPVIMSGLSLPATYLAFGAISALPYFVITLLVAWAAFRRKDL